MLLHGDCLELMPTIADQSIDLILCDLPYAVTQNSWDSLIPVEPLWREYKRLIKSGGAIVLTAQQPFSSLLVASNITQFRYSLVWEKSNPTGFLNANRMPLRCHEDILVFYDKLPTYNPQKTTGHAPYRTTTGQRSSNYGNYNQIDTTSAGDRHPRSVIKVKNERGLHPTQKPVKLMEWIIRTYTNPGETVLDNCIGSGTTAIAALRSGRQWIGIEREAQYVEAARLRIEAESNTQQ